MSIPEDACCAPSTVHGPLRGPKADRTLAQLTRALGHPARVAIVRQLASETGCLAGDLSDALPLAPSTVSAHLKTLKEAGLVAGTVDGPRRNYCLDRGRLGHLRALLDALEPEVPRLAFSSVLFLCVANRARSQMAHALARVVFGPGVRVQSAGSNPSSPHPVALKVLEEAGVSTVGLHAKHVDTIDPASVDLVVTLCAEESCPLFLGDAKRLSWPLPDPDAPGTEAEVLARFRTTRDTIHARLRALAEGRDPAMEAACR